MPTLQETMDAAREAAANLPATQTPASVPTTTFSVGLDEFLSGGGVRPDKWLAVKDAGIRIDRDNKDYIKEFTGTLDLSTVQLFYGSRAEFAGNKVVYAKSYDGVTTVKGENFNAVLEQFQANSVKDASRYRGADILITLDANTKQGSATIPAGTKVGYSTSITGFAPFQSFMSEMVKTGKAKAGPNGTIIGDTVKVKVTHQTKANGANQEYGILLFELAV